ncbi:MAG: hypothetical protein FJ290_33180 [Planctomycetes bacterium]|nr:hypothetical protein [Planctomycetota bacterium]
MVRTSRGRTQLAPGRADWRLASLLTLVGLLLALAALLFLPVVSVGSRHPPGSSCREHLRMCHSSLRLYLSDSDDFFPSAWHVAGPSVAPDLSNLTFHRFAIYSRFGGFSHIVTPAEIDACNGDSAKARRAKYDRCSQFWKDNRRGWTSDYFAPDIIFRWPAESGGPRVQPGTFSALTAAMSPSERPLFAEVNASLPNPEAKDPAAPEHEAEMRKGFSFMRESGMDIFVGAGPSLRRPGDLSTSRFDFRHNGAANVLFLDGHVELIRKDDTTRLEKIHRNWNSLEGEEGKPGATSVPPN